MYLESIEINVVPVVDVLQKTNEISTQTPIEQSTQILLDFNRKTTTKWYSTSRRRQEEEESEEEEEQEPLVEITTAENDYQYNNNNYEVIIMERPTGPIILGLVESEIIDEDIYRGEYKRYEPIEKKRHHQFQYLKLHLHLLLKLIYYLKE